MEPNLNPISNCLSFLQNCGGRIDPSSSNPISYKELNANIETAIELLMNETTSEMDKTKLKDQLEKLSSMA